MATPVNPKSLTTVGERKRKDKKKAEQAASDQEEVQRPRLNLKRGGRRKGTRGASLAAASSS